MTRTFTKGDPEKLREFAVEAARLMHDLHCEDVLLLDVSGLSQVCDYVLIGSGTSDRQMKSVASDLSDLGDECDHRCFRKSKDADATWIVCDFIDLVAHVFEPTQRAYYDLEDLWSDGKTIEWRRSGEPESAAAARPGRRVARDSDGDSAEEEAIDGMGDEASERA